MLTLATYQLGLAILITTFMIWDLRKLRFFSAFLLSALLAYLYYYIAIDWYDVYWQIPAIASFDNRFVEANLSVIGVFFLFFQLGRATVGLVRPFRRNITVSDVTQSVGSLNVLTPLLIGVLLIAINADGWWLFDPYPLNKKQFSFVELGGASALGPIILLIAVSQSQVTNSFKRLSMTVIILVSIHFSLAGDRGSLIFVAIAVYGLRLQSQRRITIRLLLEAMILASLFLILLQLIVALRTHTFGTNIRDETTFLEEINLLPQAIAHMVHSMQIYSSGVEVYDGNTVDFLLQITLQIVPSGILKALDYELYNGPWLLAGFVKHGGGFFVPAELIFVGGYSTLIFFSFYIGLFSGLNDWLSRTATKRKDMVIVVIVIVAAASNFYTFYYGVQSLMRMTTLPIVIYTIRGSLHLIRKNA